MLIDGFFWQHPMHACRALLCVCIAGIAAGTQAATLPEIIERALTRSPEVLAHLQAYNVAGRESVEPRTYGQKGLLLEGRLRPLPDDSYRSDENYVLTLDAAALRRILEPRRTLEEQTSATELIGTVRRLELLQIMDEVALSAALGYVEVQRQRSLIELAQADWNVCRDLYDRSLGTQGATREALPNASACVTRTQAVWLADTNHLQDYSARFERVVGEAPPLLAPVPDFAISLPSQDADWELSLQASIAVQAGYARLWRASVDADVRRGTDNTTAPTPRAIQGFDSHYRREADQQSDQAAYANERIRRSVEQYGAMQDARDMTCRDVRTRLTELRTKLLAQQDRLSSLARQQQEPPGGAASDHKAGQSENSPLSSKILATMRAAAVRRATTDARFDLLTTQLQVLAANHQLLARLGFSHGETTPDTTAYTPFLLCK